MIVNKSPLPKSERVRILHIITRMIVGGAQENTLLSVEGLSQLERYEVSLASGLETGPEGELLTRANKTSTLIEVPDLCRAVRPTRDARALWQLYKIIRAGRYHIVHTHSSKAGVLGRLAARMAGTPVIVHTLHGLVFHEYQPWLINRAWRLVKKTCGWMTDQFVSVSDVIREKAIAARIAHARKFVTIFSGMELDWFLQPGLDGRAVRAEFGIPPDAPVIGKIARLFHLKGHRELIDAAPAIIQRYPKVRFLLVGDGNLHAELRDRAQALGILKHFVFAGLVDRQRIPQMLAAMDVVVHTSFREGLARVLVQALAMGKPCVAFDIDGAREVVITGRTGVLVKPGDLAGLANGVCELLADAPGRERMGQEGRRLVDPAFRAETMVQQLSNLYEELVARRSAQIERFEAGVVAGADRVPEESGVTLSRG